MISFLLLISSTYVAAQVAPLSSTYTFGGAIPTQIEPDVQYGTNDCSQYGASNQTSLCQNAVINSVEDFCLWGPPFSTAEDGFGAIAYTERFEVAYCTKAGYGTRLFPDGTILGAHFVKTDSYVQITGVGDFSKIGIPADDSGGELDPHGADNLGNPQGGLVFGNAFGAMEQYHEWTNFMSGTQFCIRACRDDPAGRFTAAQYCQHEYDVLGCAWNIPGNYDTGVIEQCAGPDVDEPMGIYNGSVFHQGQPVTPDAHTAPASSACVTTTIALNGVVGSSAVSSSIASSSSPTSTPTSVTTGAPTSGSSGASSSSATSSEGTGAASVNTPALYAVLISVTIGVVSVFFH